VTVTAKLPQLHHVGISVPDLDAAKAFSAGLLGMKVVSSREWGPGDARMDTILGLEGSSGEKAVLEGPATRLELWRFTVPSPRPQPGDRRVCDHGINHLCFEVPDVAALHTRLSGAGIEFVSLPSTGPTGSVAVYARDPFGNFLELFQPPRA
jgi:catechol 2,3-dioxygenase-like lactoylglutathione lyase family enzyme